MDIGHQIFVQCMSPSGVHPNGQLMDINRTIGHRMDNEMIIADNKMFRGMFRGLTRETLRHHFVVQSVYHTGQPVVRWTSKADIKNTKKPHAFSSETYTQNDHLFETSERVFFWTSIEHHSDHQKHQ